MKAFQYGFGMIQFPDSLNPPVFWFPQAPMPVPDKEEWMVISLSQTPFLPERIHKAKAGQWRGYSEGREIVAKLLGVICHSFYSCAMNLMLGACPPTLPLHFPTMRSDNVDWLIIQSAFARAYPYFVVAREKGLEICWQLIVGSYLKQLKADWPLTWADDEVFSQLTAKNLGAVGQKMVGWILSLENQLIEEFRSAQRFFELGVICFARNPMGIPLNVIIRARLDEFLVFRPRGKRLSGWTIDFKSGREPQIQEPFLAYHRLMAMITAALIVRLAHREPMPAGQYWLINLGNPEAAADRGWADFRHLGEKSLFHPPAEGMTGKKALEWLAAMADEFRPKK